MQDKYYYYVYQAFNKGDVVPGFGCNATNMHPMSEMHEMNEENIDMYYVLISWQEISEYEFNEFNK